MLRVSVVLPALVAGVFLHGCAFAPGQYLDTAQFAGEQSPENARVELVSITPKLLAIQEAGRKADQVPRALLDYSPDSYRIGSNDVLHITVWDHPEMTAPSGPQQTLEANGRVVRPDGSLFYPYIGEIKAAGLTIEELRATIARQLTKVVTKPQVDVAVIKYASRKVVLSGAFNDTTQQPITSVPLTLLEAVGKAGVKTLDADLSSLILKRDGREYRLDLDALNRNGANLDGIKLKDGDQIHLAYNDRRRVYVMGEVGQPRALPFKTRDLNLSDVIGSVGGLRQETADGKAIYVIRGVEDLERDTAKVFQLDAKSPVAFVLAERFMLQPQDVVFVGPAGITRWNRFISQLLPSATLLRTGVGIENDIRVR
ncbi:polysaccharide biosynthesis/export family protein [Azoarcus sp. KH32C]|uniref:polysaccharide biosynthesis/export family protein n=1 Tax=Azoarcus sp. KH32C TaxID=748247 RepID=UPI000238690F|nr:polysaccharide biosynthesis/export family protein [Azoarcus sp. KH32C]BAL23226.1 capsular polysaccharide biosynthesis protein [Azoarcus sp. KH32C]